MPRSTKTGLELAYHKQAKQWCKYYTNDEGKKAVKYFGAGKSVTLQSFVCPSWTSS